MVGSFESGVGGVFEGGPGLDVEEEEAGGGGASSSRSRFGRAAERVRVEVPSPFRRGERERRGRSDLEGGASVAT